MKTVLFTLCFACIFSLALNAQVSINEDGSAPHPSSVLDIKSVSKGLLAPRMTSVERDQISSPTDGLQIFNLTTGCLNYFFGSSWYEICGNCTPGPPQPSPVSGSTTFCAGTPSLIYSVTHVPGTTYQWEVPAGWSILSGSGTASITVEPGSSGGTIEVTPVVNCAGPSQSIAVTLLSAPTSAQAGSDQLNIAGTTADLEASPAGSFTGTWSIMSGAGGSFSSVSDPDATFTGVAGDSYVLRWTLSNTCGSVFDEVSISFAPEYVPGSQNFSYTGGVQYFTVPAGITSIQVDAKGGRGGYGWSPDAGGILGAGGLGGRVQATLTVTPGEVLEVWVGGSGTNASSGTPGTGGFNGGGNGGQQFNYKGGGGGGASDLRRGGTTLNDRILVAGGGGSGSGWCTSGDGVGGGGGSLIGGSGQICSGITPGSGGTQSAGGSANGTFGIGGTSTTGTEAASAGGGGWYGGGASNGSGGGGGSSYVTMSGSSSIIHDQGVHNGSGEILIVW